MRIIGSWLRSIWSGLRGTGHSLLAGLDVLAKLAQVAAVVIAGIWTLHIHQITGEKEINPEIWVTSQVDAYSQDTRLLLVHIREKNVGKVPVVVGQDALALVVKKIPDGKSIGYIDIDKQPVLFSYAVFKRYDEGVELSPGAEYEDVAQFVVAPGMYHIEATLSLPENETVNGIAIQRVE